MRQQLGTRIARQAYATSLTNHSQGQNLKAFIFALFVSLSTASSAQVHLEAGQSYGFEFSTLPFSYDCSECGFPIATAQWNANGNLFDVGETVRATFYEGTLDGPELGHADYAVTGAPANQSQVTFGYSGAWSDLAGAVKLTMLVGSADLESLALWVVPSPGKVYELSVPIAAAVPEPASVLLLIPGLAALALCLRRKRP